MLLAFFDFFFKFYYPSFTLRLTIFYFCFVITDLSVFLRSETLAATCASTPCLENLDLRLATNTVTVEQGIRFVLFTFKFFMHDRYDTYIIVLSKIYTENYISLTYM